MYAQIAPMSWRALKYLGVSATAFGVLCMGRAVAEPISVGDPNGYLLVDQRSNNTIGRAVGERIVYGETSVVPNGAAGTIGSASTTNLATGQLVTRSLPFVGSPALPNQFSNSIAYNSGLTGPWTLSFTNGADTRAVTTPSIVGATPPPYASSVTFSGVSTNPTFAWTYANGSVNGVFFDIFDASLPNPAGGASLVYSKTLPGTANSFTVPNQLAGGLTLEQGHQYTLDLYGVVTRDGSTSLSNRNSLAWSEAYFNFTPQLAGSPVVNLPIITATGAYQYDMVVVAGQTYFIDPVVTTGYDYAIGLGDPTFASVVLPAIQSSPFTLSFLENGATVTDLLAPGTVFAFPAGGVSAFRVTGIDPALGIDPSNTTAFVTGLTFTQSGVFDGTQTPITTNITTVPEPISLAVLALGAGATVLARRRVLRPKLA